jgi:hypothetical protein
MLGAVPLRAVSRNAIGIVQIRRIRARVPPKDFRLRMPRKGVGGGFDAAPILAPHDCT